MALALFTAAPEGKEKPTLMGVVDYLHLRFLIALGLGLLTAVILLSSLLENWLQTQPTYVFAFFAGLIVASVVAIGLKVKWSATAGIALLIGAVIAFFITNPELGTLSDKMGHGGLALFVSGMIAICAMILPGISGSFILLVLGQFDFIIGAVHERDIVSLFFVAMGALIGILAFSRVLSWLLKHYENPTIALLVGFMVGSMRLIVFRMTHSSAVESALTYIPLEVTSTQWGIAFSFAVFGFIVVSLLDHLQTRSNPLIRLFMGNKTVAPVAES
jgi:putative membrane protein